MSFWNKVGDFLDSVGSSTTDAFSTAWALAAHPSFSNAQAFAQDAPGILPGVGAVHATGDALDVGHRLMQAGRGINDAIGPGSPTAHVLSFPGRHAIDNPVTRGINDLYHATVDRGVSTFGNVISDQNELGVFNFFQPSKVEDAWRRSGANDSTAGESIVQTLAGVSQATTPQGQADRARFQNSWSGKLSSGAADIAVGWYADPTVIAGKGSTIAREARTTIKSTKERTAVLDYVSGRTNAAQAGKRAQKMGDRYSAMIHSTDGLSESQIAQLPAFRSTADAGALAYLFGRANAEHAADDAARFAAKSTIFGAALGDARSIGKLKAQRTELGDEMARIAQQPTQTQWSEQFSWDDNGQGAFDLFNAPDVDPLSQRLMDQIDGKIEKLDRALAASGTTSKVTGDFIEQAVTEHSLRQGYLYSGVAGRPVRVVASAVSYRLPGHVSLKDPVAGFDQLNRTLKRMVHTDPDVRKDLLDRYVRASNAGERRAIVDETESRIVTDTAEHYGVTRDAAMALLKAGQGRRAVPLRALAGRLYSGTDAEKFISLVDPEADEMVAISRPLAKSQIEDHHPLVDPDAVDKFLRAGTNRRALEVFAGRFGENAAKAGTKAADALQVPEWANDLMTVGSRLWKDAALFRLAYPMRVQVDTQMRLLTSMGALQWLGALRGTVAGQTHYLLTDAAGNKSLRALFRSEGDAVGAMKKTLMPGGVYRGISTDPARDEEELAELTKRIFASNGGMADLLSEVADKDLRHVRGTGDWGLVEPSDAGWATAYSRAVNRQIRNSPTMMHALLEPDQAALKRWVTSTKEGQAEWRELKAGWRNLDDWLLKVRDHVDHYIPEESGLRQVVEKRNLNDGDLAGYFGGQQTANRMRVHGESFSPTSSTTNGFMAKYHKVREGWYQWASEVPETVMGRSPLYGHSFTAHMHEQIDRLDPGPIGPELEMHLRKNADKLARRDVAQVLFDTSDVSNLATHMRFVSPFFAAWQDTMVKWGRLIYQDPSRVVHGMQLWHAPNRLGLIVDSEGNRVDADGHVYDASGKRVDTDPNYRGRGQDVVIPLPQALAKKFGVGAFRIDKDSANIVFQGEPWWLPGFGPMVQVPVNEVVRREFPEAVDDPILKFVLPFGVTDDSPGRQLAPAWLRRAQDAFGDTPDHASVYAMLLEQERVKYNLGERKSLDGVEEEVARKTRNWFLMRAVLSANSPVSVRPTPRFQFYIDQAHAYRQRYGKDWQARFYDDFPEYFEMSTELSANETGIVASEKAYDATKRYRSLIAANPEYGWLYVGPENDPAQPFNQGVYTWQSSTAVSPAGGKTFRGKKDPGEALADAEASKGWIEYQQANAALDGALQRRGLHSLAQRGAEDLRAIKQQFVTELGNENPSWGKAYNDRGGDQVKAFFGAVSAGLRQDKSLAARSDFKLLQEYIEGRNYLREVLATRDRKSLDANPDLEAAWDEFGAELKEQNFGFAAAWDRILEGDDLSTEITL